MARLHRVDVNAVGLSDFGRPNGYVSRQVARWSKQYLASKTDDMPAMDKLMTWLPDHLPAHDETAIAHGDYRLGNLMLAPDKPEVVAILDWELSTLGHPIADLAYYCLPYHLPSDLQGMRGWWVKTWASWVFSTSRKPWSVTASSRVGQVLRTGMCLWPSHCSG